MLKPLSIFKRWVGIDKFPAVGIRGLLERENPRNVNSCTVHNGDVTGVDPNVPRRAPWLAGADGKGGRRAPQNQVIPHIQGAVKLNRLLSFSTTSPTVVVSRIGPASPAPRVEVLRNEKSVRAIAPASMSIRPLPQRQPYLHQ